MKLIFRAAFSFFCLIVLSVNAAGQTPPVAGITLMNSDTLSADVLAGGAGGNLTYHGGPVQHIQKIFTIFWDPSGVAFPAGYQTTINQFVQDLNGSTFYGIASQYSDGTSNISTSAVYGGTWLDNTNAFPDAALTFSDLLAEVNRAKTANSWTSDANSYFQVYTPSGIASTDSGICGLHWFANPAIGQILFPQSGCFPGGTYPNGSTVDAAINVSSHEILETLTDPLGNAWYFNDVSGEMADLCNFNFGARASDGSNVTLNGHKYVVQQEWSNAISGCTLTSIPPNLLTVSKSGTGSGTVTSNPAGINCGAICSASYTAGQVVVLTATPSAGSSFSGWSGDADCGDGSVTMSVAVTCTANFSASAFALTITKSGTGSGTVTSNPAGINCGVTCSTSYAFNQVVTLTATPAAGSASFGFSGDADCSDGTVTMSSARNCTAIFAQALQVLTVSKNGTGSGTVTSNPAGINCGTTCNISLPGGLAVALIATPAAGSTFVGWSGDADCTDGNVTMTSARNCAATFTLGFMLTVSRNGAGNGTVSTNPSGINCGGTCSAIFPSGQTIVLMATPAAGSTFSGWSGAADCADGSVTMTAARNCTATFAQITFNLTLSKIGTGNGTLTSNPAVVLCGDVCAITFVAGQVETLTATPAAGSIFRGWSGDADCIDGNVTMSADRNCIARFDQRYNDFDGDGNSDIVWQNTNGSTALWLMNGLNVIGGTGLTGPGTGWSIVQIGDFNGDGKNDVVWQNVDGSAAIWLMNGLSVISGGGLIGPGTGWSVKAIGDFNGDGKSDVVWQNVDGSAAIWLMNGLSVISGGGLIGPGTGWSVKAIGDFNGDGKSDVVWQNVDGSAAIWLMDGLNVISGGGLIGPGTGWSVNKVADFNGDGKTDILVQHTDGSAAIWLMNGLSAFSSGTLIGPGTGWSVKAIGDFNGDGKSDVVWQHTDGSAAIWLMNGLSVVGSGGGLMGPSSGWSVWAIGDLNGDGLSDIVWQHTDGSAAIWLMNGVNVTGGNGLIGPGTGWSPVP